MESYRRWTICLLQRLLTAPVISLRRNMQDYNIFVSVIIPTYIRAHTLKRAVESVMSQTFQNYELIIIDDGSTDDTEQLVR